jgi:hypothetical protein
MQATLNYSPSDSSSVIKLSSQEFVIVSLIVKEPGTSIQDLIHKVSFSPLEVLQFLESLFEKGLITTDDLNSVLTESQYTGILETVMSYSGAGGERIVRNYFHIGMRKEEAINNLPQFEKEISSLVGKNLGQRLTEKIKSILSEKNK